MFHAMVMAARWTRSRMLVSKPAQLLRYNNILKLYHRCISYMSQRCLKFDNKHCHCNHENILHYPHIDRAINSFRYKTVCK